MLKKICSLAILSLPLLSGCSVAMALHGKPTPNLNVVAVGNDRSQVESRLGSPAVTTNLENGKTKSSYQYEVGSDSSPTRAVGYVVLDVLFLFIPELITIPLEASLGDKYVAEVVYDKNDKIVDMSLNKGTISNIKR